VSPKGDRESVLGVSKERSTKRGGRKKNSSSLPIPRAEEAIRKGIGYKKKELGILEFLCKV